MNKLTFNCIMDDLIYKKNYDIKLYSNNIIKAFQNEEVIIIKYDDDIIYVDIIENECEYKKIQFKVNNKTKYITSSKIGTYSIDIHTLKIAKNINNIEIEYKIQISENEYKNCKINIDLYV